MSAPVLLPYTHQCFVCGADNPHGLRLRFRAEHDVIHAEFRPRPEHCGYRGVVHGGVVAGALDEVMFWAATYAHRRMYVSIDLAVRYSRRVAAGTCYRLVARCNTARARLCATTAELRDADGVPCVTAQGKYFPLAPGDVPLALEDFCDDPATLSAREFMPGPGPAGGKG
ncbi:hypothetical protein HQ590_10655 [bacterium]|nr:hypothetical protein [bacterium]